MPRVTAIDLDPVSIDLARRHERGAHIDYVLGDFLTVAFEPSSFDVIVSVAALHHMAADVALARIRDLLRPGGTLALIGLARPDLPADLPFVLAGVVAPRFHELTKTCWEHPSPTVWPPPDTFAGMRHLVTRILPGARFRRRRALALLRHLDQPHC